MALPRVMLRHWTCGVTEEGVTACPNTPLATHSTYPARLVFIPYKATGTRAPPRDASTLELAGRDAQAVASQHSANRIYRRA